MLPQCRFKGVKTNACAWVVALLVGLALACGGAEKHAESNRVYRRPLAVDGSGEVRAGGVASERGGRRTSPDEGKRSEGRGGRERREAMEQHQSRGIDWIDDRHPQP